MQHLKHPKNFLIYHSWRLLLFVCCFFKNSFRGWGCGICCHKSPNCFPPHLGHCLRSEKKSLKFLSVYINAIHSHTKSKSSFSLPGFSTCRRYLTRINIKLRSRNSMMFLQIGELALILWLESGRRLLESYAHLW